MNFRLFPNQSDIINLHTFFCSLNISLSDKEENSVLSRHCGYKGNKEINYLDRKISLSTYIFLLFIKYKYKNFFIRRETFFSNRKI